MNVDRFLAAAVLLVLSLGRAFAGEGEPVKGLRASAEVLEKAGAVEVRLTLTNVSERPLAVCTWLGGRSIGVTWTGPDGKPRTSNHYEWMKAARIRALIADDFVTLAPGKSLVIGPQGRDSTLALPGAEAGRHSLILSYSNVLDGKKLGIADAWTGTVAAPAVAVTVK